LIAVERDASDIIESDPFVALPEEAIQNLDGKRPRGIGELGKDIVPILAGYTFDNINGVEVANKRQLVPILCLDLPFSEEGSH
jgi:hypothetical protein